jgi:hypothetical protein
MRRKGMVRRLVVIATVFTSSIATGEAPIGLQAVPRDAFPVFDNPKMLPAAEAEAKGVVTDRDMVIGVARGREAKAYPITIMGVHELGNDTIDGEPIAVTW